MKQETYKDNENTEKALDTKDLVEENDLALEKRKKNLAEPWKKGQSGNPKGLKKGTLHKKTILRMAIKEKFGIEVKDPYEWYAAYKLGIVKDAKSDHLKNTAIEQIMDRMVEPIRREVKHEIGDEVKKLSKLITGEIENSIDVNNLIEDVEYSEVEDD